MSGGFNNMLHFIGIVEDSNDMTNSGRVKVRAFGIHPPKKGANEGDDVPTDHLPWATVVDNTYGVAPSVPAVGEFVFGFFIDGRDAQQPFVTGRLPGMNFAYPAGAGEPGEDGYIPPESITKYGQPEMHRYNTGENAVQGQGVTQAYDVDSEIPQADGEVFDEPNIVMPERNMGNRIIQSKDGDNFLVLGDGEDSDGNGYILLSHSSGSVFQIDAQGTLLVKSYGDTFNSVHGVHTQYVTGSSHTNIQEDYTLRVEKGSGKIYIHGDLDIEANNISLAARGTMNLNAGTKMNMSAGGIGMQATADDINLVAVNNTKIQTGNITNGGGFYCSAVFGDFHIDTYKTNMFSTAYTKITSLGTPAISTQVLPYPDLGHKGVEINSPVLVSLRSAAGIINIDALTAVHIDSIGTTTLNSTGITNVQGGSTNVDATKLVNLGMGTTSLVSKAAVVALRANQGTILTEAATPSITELAKVVKPPSIDGVKPTLGAQIERAEAMLTSIMGSGDNLEEAVSLLPQDSDGDGVVDGVPTEQRITQVNTSIGDGDAD